MSDEKLIEYLKRVNDSIGVAFDVLDKHNKTIGAICDLLHVMEPYIMKLSKPAEECESAKEEAR